VFLDVSTKATEPPAQTLVLLALNPAIGGVPVEPFTTFIYAVLVTAVEAPQAFDAVNVTLYVPMVLNVIVGF
jgi:hypothetical protein